MNSLTTGLDLTEPLQNGSNENSRPHGSILITYMRQKLRCMTLIAIVIPSLVLTVGLYFKEKCSVNENISLFMIVSGSCCFVLIGLCIFVLILKMQLDVHKESMINTVRITISIVMCLLLVVMGGIILFLIIWLVYGYGLILSTRHTVQFIDPTVTETYCHPVLYYSSFVYLIISFSSTIIFCLILHCFRDGLSLNPS